jgi:UDP-glucose 4-epimerase
MKVLVTGATGFLGKHVVARLHHGGAQVVALVRPARALSDDCFPAGVRVARGDLRRAETLVEAMQGIDAVIHLAASVVGDDDTQFLNTVVGTENLLEAMARGRASRLVHCSTFSVYDWNAARGTLSESSPLEADLYHRDGYAIAKTWQERLVRRYAQRHGWKLTVLRPGFLWGAGGDALAGVGPSLGPFHLALGGARALPLSYVENCADAIATAWSHPAAFGETFNVLDDPRRSAWEYLGRILQARRRFPATGTTRRTMRVYVPYACGLGAAYLATGISKLLFRQGGKLPSLLVPSRYRARFKPLRFSNRKLRETLAWEPPFGWQEAWDRTLASLAQGGAAGRNSAARAPSPQLPAAIPEPAGETEIPLA